MPQPLLCILRSLAGAVIDQAQPEARGQGRLGIPIIEVTLLGSMMHRDGRAEAGPGVA